MRSPLSARPAVTGFVIALGLVAQLTQQAQSAPDAPIGTQAPRLTCDCPEQTPETEQTPPLVDVERGLTATL